MKKGSEEMLVKKRRRKVCRREMAQGFEGYCGYVCPDYRKCRGVSLQLAANSFQRVAEIFGRQGQRVNIHHEGHEGHEGRHAVNKKTSSCSS